MLSFNEHMSNSGGYLAALADRSAAYINEIVSSGINKSRLAPARTLTGTVVHAGPHLDEYFADLLFRSCLPATMASCPIEEQTLFSASDDLGAKHLWPTSALIGIGEAVDQNVVPLYSFDEHSLGGRRTDLSCSQIVSTEMLRSLPSSISLLLAEINTIDSYGGAHAQHLANLVKSLHEVSFDLGVDPGSGAPIRDTLSAEWKRSIVQTAITAVVYCLENGIDLAGDYDGKARALKVSLDNYVAKSAHRNSAGFAESEQRMRSVFGDQRKTFREAMLPGLDLNGQVVHGTKIPQMLITSRVAFACEQCWGAGVRDLVMTHFWESEMQGQLSFRSVKQALASMIGQGLHQASSPVGSITFVQARMKGASGDIWVISFTPEFNVIKGHQAISNYVKLQNNHQGVWLIRNRVIGTCALFKGDGVSEVLWEKVVADITTSEPDLWHVTRRPDQKLVPYILNGGVAYQYVPRSALDSAALLKIVERHLA